MLLGKLKIIFSDTFSFIFLMISVFSVFTFEIFIVLPAFGEGIVPRYVHWIVGTILLISILSNLAMTMLEDTTTQKIVLPSILRPEWRFCFSCEANSPPRAFHCDKCKGCVLRRDHHCVFAGCCIGLKNFRYFLTFLFYLAIGSLYASYLNMYFIWDVLGGFSMFSVCVHIIPFVFFMLGYLNWWVFICTLISVLAIVGFIFVTNLFVLHATQMIRNQTTFEKNNRITMYDLGWRRNLEECLGMNWRKGWLFPLIRSPLPSDGLVYSTNLTTYVRPSSGFPNNLRQRH